MTVRTRLGRLVIAWGPYSRDHAQHREPFDVLRKEPSEVLYLFPGFHAWAVNDDPDPFASRYFGAVLKALLEGNPVVLTDEVFVDPRRRRHVERAYQRVFPDLVVDHAYLGDGSGPVPGPEDGIVIDDDVYEEGEEGSNESILVESDASRDVLVAALASAAERMMGVGEDGQEYSDDVALIGDEQVYTPNYFSDVTIDKDGNPGFYIDCKGGIEPPMAAKFRQVLVEELMRHGVVSAHVRVRS